MRLRVTIELDLNDRFLRDSEGDEIYQSGITGDFYGGTKEFLDHQLGRDIQHADKVTVISYEVLEPIEPEKED